MCTMYIVNSFVANVVVAIVAADAFISVMHKFLQSRIQIFITSFVSW